ncbi:hypothetical protein TWF730_003781 [Orbilia blumenaviensis]|uniref:Uncharacterized protein n=1 Tax=Orbilia blumenaviensis TaxID=1796055 RepID=A0AAV9U3D0_9PEZI
MAPKRVKSSSRRASKGDAENKGSRLAGTHPPKKDGKAIDSNVGNEVCAVDPLKVVRVIVQVISLEDVNAIIRDMSSATTIPTKLWPTAIRQWNLGYPFFKNLLKELESAGIQVSAIFIPNDSCTADLASAPSAWCLCTTSIQADSYLCCTLRSAIPVVCISNPSFEMRMGSVADYEGEIEKENLAGNARIIDEAIKLNMLMTRNPFHSLKDWGQVQQLDSEEALSEEEQYCIDSCLTSQVLVAIKKAWARRSNEPTVPGAMGNSLLGLLQKFAGSKEKLTAGQFKSQPAVSSVPESFLDPDNVKPGVDLESRIMYCFQLVLSRLYYEEVENESWGLPELVDPMDLIVHRLSNSKEPKIEDEGELKRLRMRFLENQRFGKIWLNLIRGYGSYAKPPAAAKCKLGFGAFILFDIDESSSSGITFEDIHDGLQTTDPSKIYNKLREEIRDFEAALPTLENITLSLAGFALAGWWEGVDCPLFHKSSNEILQEVGNRNNVARLIIPRFS